MINELIRRSLVDHRTHELTEESIRPTIMVELLKEPAPTKRQARLRDGGDGLQVDDTKSRCDNTVQGVRLVTDSMGTLICQRRHSSFSCDANAPVAPVIHLPVRLCMHTPATRFSASRLL